MRRNPVRIALVLVLAFVLLCSCASPKSAFEQPKKVTVSLSVSSLTLFSGEQYTFNPTFKNTDEQPDLIWTSSDESVLEVTQSGIVMAKNQTDKSQKAKVTATLESNPNMKSECTVTVFSPFQVHFVTAGPGQDARSQAIISWHSPYPASVLEYTDANGDSFTNSVTLDGERTKSDWADLFSIYRYKTVLENLEPDCTYKYRIKIFDTHYSQVQEFRTAGEDGTFSVAWLSDVHASRPESLENIRQLLGYMNEKEDIAFCLFSGDFVNQGKRYGYWESWTDGDLLDDMEYAFAIGNHEYYPNNTADKATPSYYLDFVAIPENSGQSPDSDFWFRYDNVLFICLDTMAADFGGLETREKQAQWFRSVVEKNKGSYTYLIAAQHYAFLDGDAEGTGFYSFWYPIFDECGVDLALASDSHIYSRSKTLFGDQVSEQGTVYMTSPMTEGKALSEIVSKDDQTGRRSAFFSVDKVVGGAYIKVTPQSLTVHVIGKDGAEYDSVTIRAR